MLGHQEFSSRDAATVLLKPFPNSPEEEFSAGETSQIEVNHGSGKLDCLQDVVCRIDRDVLPPLGNFSGHYFD